jgi:hypothetical protein
MAEYQTYKDANGVTWTILTGANSFAATVLPNAQPRYDPEAPDVGPVVKPSLDASATDAEVLERDRRAFSNLRSQIDKYADGNRQHVILRVTARADAGGGGALALLLLVVLLAASE